jgi:tetratricopeptide (TPR) repeat protein
MRQKFSFNKLLGILLIVLLLASCKQKENHKTQETENAPLSELTQLIRENPDDINLYVERAKLYYEEEAYDEAIDDVVKAQNIDSLRPDLYHLLADIYLDYYKSYEALKTMEKVVSLHPERIPSLLKLAEFQYILKQYNESVNTCNEILAVDRLEPEAYFMLGMNFRALDDIERAKNAFQTAVENNPELIDAWLMLGSIHEYQGDSTAMLYYDNALLIAPESIEALHAKAFYLQNNDRIPEAIGIYKQIIGIDPQYTDAYLNTGLLYLELDSLGQAYEQFNILIGIDVTNPLAYFYRGYTFEQGGEINKARADYEQALRLSPDFEEARNALKLLSDEES